MKSPWIFPFSKGGNPVINLKHQILNFSFCPYFLFLYFFCVFNVSNDSWKIIFSCTNSDLVNTALYYHVIWAWSWSKWPRVNLYIHTGCEHIGLQTGLLTAQRKESKRKERTKKKTQGARTEYFIFSNISINPFKKLSDKNYL